MRMIKKPPTPAAMRIATMATMKMGLNEDELSSFCESDERDC